jgi:hypothetical protein
MTPAAGGCWLQSRPPERLLRAVRHQVAAFAAMPDRKMSTASFYNIVRVFLTLLALVLPGYDLGARENKPLLLSCSLRHSKQVTSAGRNVEHGSARFSIDYEEKKIYFVSWPFKAQWYNENKSYDLDFITEDNFIIAYELIENQASGTLTVTSSYFSIDRANGQLSASYSMVSTSDTDYDSIEGQCEATSMLRFTRKKF